MSEPKDQTKKTTKTEEVPVCTKPFNPESQRLQDDDEPCSDGENRNKKD
ncbi:MAG TPA: hypothetical protein GXZ47_08930 [Treponema sp.]|nr:hypothetical protein [Treponema sp.]